MKEQFKTLMGNYPTGVSIITTYSHEDHGYTANSLSSISLSPVIISFTLRAESGLFDFFLNAAYMGISILTISQENVARIFSSKMPMNYRFRQIKTKRGVNNCLLVEFSVATIECKKLSQHMIGDHLVIYAEVTNSSIHGGVPLVYHRKNYTSVTSTLSSDNVDVTHTAQEKIS
ncbi:MAG: flavin reductase family protein [Legionellaceae bacterium]|nr:flavin reductase family protein [Legionellaceae bacterium]